MDISWDDQVLAVGTEDGTIEVYNFPKILALAGKSQENLHGGSRSKRASTSPALMKLFKTKSNGILLTKFTWRNFLYAIGSYN